jgi:hypothetical protein
MKKEGKYHLKARDLGQIAYENYVLKASLRDREDG